MLPDYYKYIVNVYFYKVFLFLGGFPYILIHHEIKEPYIVLNISMTRPNILGVNVVLL